MSGWGLLLGGICVVLLAGVWVCVVLWREAGDPDRRHRAPVSRTAAAARRLRGRLRRRRPAPGETAPYGALWPAPGRSEELTPLDPSGLRGRLTATAAGLRRRQEEVAGGGDPGERTETALPAPEPPGEFCAAELAEAEHALNEQMERFAVGMDRLGVKLGEHVDHGC